MRPTCSDCGKREPCDDECPNAQESGMTDTVGERTAIIEKWNKVGECFAEMMEVNRQAMPRLTPLKCDCGTLCQDHRDGFRYTVTLQEGGKP